MRRLHLHGILLLASVAIASSSTTSCSCDGGDDDTSSSSGGAGQGGSGSGSGAGGAGGGGFVTTGTASGGGGAGGEGVGGGDESCVFVPPAGDFAPSLDCAWNGPAVGSPYQNYNDVVSTPVVVNLTDDNADNVVDLDDIPDIAFITYRLQEDGCCNQRGVLRVVSGGCNADGSMTEHYSVGGNEIQAQIGVADVWLDNSGGLAAGDIDADGSVDLVATTRAGGTIAFERDGTVKWYQPMYPLGGTAGDHLAGTTPSIADLDADGNPEVIQGRVVLNGADGSLKWKGTAGVGTNGFMGPVSSAADIDLDGDLEVLAGSTAYSADGAVLWTFDFGVPITAANCQASGFPCDGYTATGNFDADDEAEVVIVRAGVVYFVNHDGTPMLDPATTQPVRVDLPVDNCTRNEGGPPTIADFDGDGDAEVGVAGADFYAVIDLECLATPLPAQCSDPGIRWKQASDDCSSRVTASSVFDFDGDGKTEVIYNDEQFFRAYDGTTGAVLIQVANKSHTRLEMPVIADVDNDGNAEILFVENASGGGTTQGIRIYADGSDAWVPTRRIWNQHAYHVTNVTELGMIPVPESPNWLEPTLSTPSGRMNNFRQNLPAFDVFAAPDLTVELSFSTASCPAFLGLVAKVCNEGALQVGAGVPVAFYDNGTGDPIACGNAPTATTAPLNPGACQNVVCQLTSPPVAPSTIDVRACVDNQGYDCAASPSSGGANNECREENNLSDGTGVGCPQIN